MWDACKCRTRAETARKTGESRIRSAEVVAAGEIDEGRLKAMESAQEDMKQARRNYVQEASSGNELSDEDKKDIQTAVVPQITSLLSQVTTLVNNVTGLFGNIQQNVTGAGISAIKSMAMGGGGTGATQALLGPVRTLLGVVKSMLSNVQALSSDAQSLTGGTAGVSSSPMGGGKMGLPCFIGASEE